MKLSEEQRAALKRAGFVARFVSHEELEDGIGVVIGMNYIKNAGTDQAVWYTQAEALEEIEPKTPPANGMEGRT